MVSRRLAGHQGTAFRPWHGGGRERDVCPRLPLLAGPMVMSLSPSHRYLFWTEWGQYPRIERSRLDGTERMVLVNVSISWPNGISVDYEVRQPSRADPGPGEGLQEGSQQLGLWGTWLPSPGCWRLLSNIREMVQGGLPNPRAFCRVRWEVWSVS